MAVRYRSSDGCWEIEVACLTGTPDKHDGERIRLRNYGWYVADVRSITDLERYVPLSDLEDELGSSRLNGGRRFSPSYSNHSFAPSPAGAARARRPSGR